MVRDKNAMSTIPIMNPAAVRLNPINQVPIPYPLFSSGLALKHPRGALCVALARYRWGKSYIASVRSLYEMRVRTRGVRGV